MLAHKLLNKDEVLDNDLRGKIMEYLVAKPGSYLGKISRELDVPTSTLKYHLNILRAFDFITTVKKGRCRHYFPKRRRFSDLEKRMYAAIEHDPTRRIVEIIYRRPGISQGGLVRETGLSQSTVAWHMAKLEEMNLIRSHRNEVKEYYLRDVLEDALRKASGDASPQPEGVEAPTAEDGTLSNADAPVAHGEWLAVDGASAPPEPRDVDEPRVEPHANAMPAVPAAVADAPPEPEAPREGRPQETAPQA